MKNKIYIVGVGRSGTSLLQAMLNAHPEIVFIPELRFFQSYLLPNEKNVDCVEATELMGLLCENSLFKRYDVDLEKLFELCDFKHIKKAKLLDVYNALFEYYDNKDIEYCGEKDPRLLESVQIIERIFPDAKIFNIIRDPRDVVLSKLKASWSSSKGFYINLFITEAQLYYGRKHGGRVDGYMEVFYEQLIGETEVVLRSICKFLNIGYKQVMVEYHQNDSGLVHQDEMQWKSNALKPVISSNKEKWRSELSTVNIAEIEGVCRTAFDYPAYKKTDSYNQLNFFKRLRVVMVCCASRAFTFFYPLIRKVF